MNVEGASSSKDTNGKKFDAEKDRWALLPYGPIREIVQVLTFGSRKYGDWNWIKVDNSRERYFSAAMRHLTAWWEGEPNDPETGYSHLSHAGTCLLFLHVLEKNKTKVQKLDSSLTKGENKRK